MSTPASPIYLDYNATAPVLDRVVETVSEALGLVGNPSSVHQAGRAAKACLAEARENLAAAINASSGSIVFTSGGTEANATVFHQHGLKRAVLCATDHPSVLEAAQANGLEVHFVPVDNQGVIEGAALEALLPSAGDETVFSFALANNETGVIQPAPALVSIARQGGARIHIDAVQALGKLPLDLASLGADYVSLSAHKIGGPKGVGALVLDEKVNLDPLIPGGGQERRRRSGTENVPGIAGFGTAAQAVDGMLADSGRVAALRDHLEVALLARNPDAIIHGRNSERLPNTTCISLPGVSAETQLLTFDLAGFCVSAGSACSSGKVSRSHVLTAMGVDDAIAQCAIRISLGWGTAPDEIDQFVDAWADLSARHRAQEAV